MVMALRGILGQKVFLTIGAGGYLHLEPEQWRPIIEAASPDVRGVMMYSPYDLDRIGKSLDVILPMLADRGIAYQFVEYEADGHVFPDDFATTVSRSCHVPFRKIEPVAFIAGHNGSSGVNPPVGLKSRFHSENVHLCSFNRVASQKLFRLSCHLL